MYTLGEEWVRPDHGDSPPEAIRHRGDDRLPLLPTGRTARPIVRPSPPVSYFLDRSRRAATLEDRPWIWTKPLASDWSKLSPSS